MGEKVRVDIADIPNHVSACLQLALLLEVSAYPKPGNVHRNADFGDTRYEHFLASAVALYSHFRNAAARGVSLASGSTPVDKVGVGNIIRDAVESMLCWQRGGNTLLGAIILLCPLAVAAGKTFSEGKFSLKRLRENLDLIVKSTTVEDAVAVYDAIEIAKPGGLGHAPSLDVNNPDSKREILEKGISLYDVFKIASGYDLICREWIKNYPVTFDFGYPFFVEVLDETSDVNVATVQTFLKILAEFPDTLIARKAGIEKAKEVSARAKEILRVGGLKTSEGRKMVYDFDRELRMKSNLLNPGTTADILSAVLGLHVLSGYRP